MDDLRNFSLKDMERKIGEIDINYGEGVVTAEIVEKKRINPDKNSCKLFVWDTVIRFPDGSEISLLDLSIDVEGIHREVGMFG